ncbi:MAG TPA: cytochrome c oxidase subunit 3 [Burkholderiaceae bacterium]|nr:cytochrome c oxidase subunit 3 [Burkholderiaceae bacterium]
MTLTLVVLALLMGAIVWWLLRQTVNVQPWNAQLAVQDAHPAVLARPAAKTALWVFLGVATALFALFISAYAMRLNYLDWAPLPQPRLLMANTAVLIVASLTMEWTVFAARRGDAERVRKGLLAAGALTIVFLAGQLVVWKQLGDAGYFLASSAATAFFYLLTAVHGVHVLGGLVAWTRTVGRVRRGEAAGRVRLSVELCAIYWHFLLIVWIVLFAVLVSNYLGLSVCTPTQSL